METSFTPLASFAGGIAGFCPGGALPALGTLDSRIIIFVVAFIAGMLATRFLSDWARLRPHPAE